MKILLLLYLLYAPQRGSSQRSNLFNKNGRSQSSRSSSNRFGTPMRIKPGLWKNLLPLKNKGHQDAALAPGFNVQGTALIKNGKVKLDLTMQGANARLKDVSATTVPVSTLPTSATTATATATATPTSAAGLTSAAPTITSGTPSAASSPSVTPVISTLPPSTTLGTTSGPTTPVVTTVPTTPAVTTVPTTPAITGTTAAGSTTAGATSGPTTASVPPTELATVATTMATTTQRPAETSAPVSTTLPTTSSATLAPSVVTSAPPIPTSSSATTKILITGGPTKPTCESPLNVNIMIVAKEVLKSHNAYRRTHASPEIHLDSQMICDAQTFAQEIAHRGILQHQASEILAKKKLGENIGMSCAPMRSGRLHAGRIIQMAKNVAKRWYDEVCQYNFDKPNTIPSTGHFTEIVWSGTKKLGVGYAVGKNAGFPGYECVYVVGRYKPAGNIIGGRRLQMNVKRGSFNRAYCQKRSIGPEGDPWDKRNHLKHKGSGTRRLYGHSKHHI